MRNSSSLDWLRFMHTPNDYRVSQFYPLGEHPEFKMPFIIRNHSGKGMEERLDMLIRNLKEKGYPFMTYSEFAQIKLAELNKPNEQ